MISRPALLAAAASRMMRWGELDDGGAMAVDVVDDNRRASTPGHRSAGRRTRLPARARSIGSTLSKSDAFTISSIAISGDVYGHTSDDTARAAIDALAGRLGLVDASGQ